MYFLRVVDVIRSGNSSKGHSLATALMSVVPDIGVSAFKRAKTYLLLTGTPTSALVLFKRMIADWQSGGRSKNAFTFLRDFPATTTRSMLQRQQGGLFHIHQISMLNKEIEKCSASVTTINRSLFKELAIIFQMVLVCLNQHQFWTVVSRYISSYIFNWLTHRLKCMFNHAA